MLVCSCDRSHDDVTVYVDPEMVGNYVQNPHPCHDMQSDIKFHTFVFDICQ